MDKIKADETAEREKLMRINYMTLENFQGIKSLEIKPFGLDMVICGDNATGKTTIANAITWLLYGKPLDGSKNFSPKPKNEDGEDVHFLESSVEAQIDASGEILCLKKVLKENWAKTKGAQEKTFKGNVTECFIDGVPVSAGTFQNRIDVLCPPDWVRILTNPFFFSQELSWQERRTKLLDMCGDVPDLEVITSTPALRELETLLVVPGAEDKAYSIDDFSAMKKSEMKKINAELQSVSVRIDEAAKAMPETTGETKKALADSIKVLKEEKETLERKRAALSESTAKAELEIEVNRLTMEMARMRMDFDNAENRGVAKIKAEKEAIETQLRELEQKKSERLRSLEDEERVVEIMTKARGALLAEYQEVSSEHYLQSDTCPTCGQLLPEEKLAEAEANWNEAKAKKLAAINARGNAECSKKKIDEAATRVADVQKRIADIDIKIDEKKQLISTIVVPQAKHFEDTEDFQGLQEKTEDAKAQIERGSVDTKQAAAPILEAIKCKENEISEIEQKRLNLEFVRTQKKRIDELAQQEKDLAAAYECAERALYLCELFIQQKARMLNDAINSQFETVRFRLFDTQINGGIKECCDVLVPGNGSMVPFVTANNAGKINAGIEIINAFSEHTGIYIPLIVDNAEAVTKLYPTKNQLFKLVVDEEAKKITIKED